MKNAQFTKQAPILRVSSFDYKASLFAYAGKSVITDGAKYSVSTLIRSSGKFWNKKYLLNVLQFSLSFYKYIKMMAVTVV